MGCWPDPMERRRGRGCRWGPGPLRQLPARPGRAGSRGL